MVKRLSKADIRIYLGKTGSGKSFLARNHLKKFKRMVLYDPVEEPDNEAMSDIVCYTAGELIKALLDKPKGPLVICWRGFKTYRRDAFEIGNRICNAAGDLLLYWDEVDTFQEKTRLAEYAYDIINTGRHRGLRVFACSRRPARVPIDIRANANRICVFNTHEPTDLRALSERMGDEAVKELPRIREYHALDWSENGAKVKKSPFA